VPTIPRSHLTLGLAESYLRLRLGTLPYPTGLSVLGRSRQPVSSALPRSYEGLALARTKFHQPRTSLPVAMNVSLARRTHGRPPGPRGWISLQPSASPRFPLVEASPVPAPSYESHIFASVPELDFSFRRKAFGTVASIPEKLRLLSQPRSQRSAQALTERPLRSFMMQVVRGKRSQTTSPSQDSAPLAVRPTWILETAPYATKEEADRIWRQGTRSLSGAHSPLSQSSFTGGNTLKVMADIEHPRTGKAEAKVALDTQSDVTTCLREYLSDIRPIIPDTVSGCAEFDEEGTLHIYSQSQQQGVALPALVAPRHQLPFDCIALLGVPALLELEVAVDQHLALPQFSPLICHLGKKKLREWLVHHPDSTVNTSPFDLEAIQINPRLSPERIAKVKAVIRKYAKVFERAPELPPKAFQHRTHHS
jgi:hypothetical protein